MLAGVFSRQITPEFWCFFSPAPQLVIVYSVLHSVFFAMRCLFWDSNHFVCVCVCMCVFVLAWHLSFHRGCLPDRERGAHTKSVYGGGRLKAIIIYPRMHRGNGGSVKAFLTEGSAMNGSDAKSTPLAELLWSLMRWETDAAKGGRGTRM